MTAFGGFPTGPVAPGMAPGGAQPVQTQVVWNMPADPNWEPIEQTDTLDQDGYYCVRIAKESYRNGTGKSKAGVWLTLEISDQDAAGKRLSNFMQDPTTTTEDTWWKLRSIMRSVFGSTAAGQQQAQYSPGVLTNRIAYIRSGAYSQDGTLRTGVDAFVTKDEYDAAVGSHRHRWPPKVRAAAGGSAVGALPTGLPGAFPGAPAFGGAAGLPGAPMAPIGGGVPAAAPLVAPAPSVAPPMQQAAMQQAPLYQPPPASLPAPPPVAPPQQQGAPSPFAGFPPAPAAAAAAPSPFAGFPPPPPAAAPTVANGAPQPAAPALPGLPGVQR